VTPQPGGSGAENAPERLLTADERGTLRAVARGDANLTDHRVFADLARAGLVVYGTAENDAGLTTAGENLLAGEETD
jgi:hypothetical protein